MLTGFSSFLLILTLIKHVFNKTILLAFIFIPVVILSFYSRGALSFFLIYCLPILIILTSETLLRLPRLFLIASLTVIFATNVYHFKNLTYANNALTPIGTFNIITVSDREKAVDWIYQKSDGESFAIWIYTIPYFQDESWTYFFDWYGQKKYGYLPEKTANFSPNELHDSKYFFAIYEPDDNSPFRLITWKDEVNKNFGTTIDTFNSNDVWVSMHTVPVSN